MLKGAHQYNSNKRNMCITFSAHILSSPETKEIPTCRRNDLELPNIECISIEITVHHRKFLHGTFYRPPNSPGQTLSAIEDLIGLAFDSNINDVFFTGDFNLDTLKIPLTKKILLLCNPDDRGAGSLQ